MKRILLIFVTIISSILANSCFFSYENCTSSYFGELRIDGKKGGSISVKYIGPNERKYREEFKFYPEINTMPYSKFFVAHTICKTKDFRHRGYEFLEIENLSPEDMYIFAATNGAEVDENFKGYYLQLFYIYKKQDKDPTYDYTRDPLVKEVRYVDRYELYEQLIRENYPYIIKLALLRKDV
ncbi:hypothetical protein [Capnocytophaga leadbetteri]